MIVETHQIAARLYEAPNDSKAAESLPRMQRPKLQRLRKPIQQMHPRKKTS